MKLVIAEKPAMGRDIASFLGIRTKGKGYIECDNGYTVTWAIGHVLKQAEPDFYVKPDSNGKKFLRQAL